jgi:hypothetical protein
MAKALLGHVGVGTDLRLAAEVRRLRARVAELEAELAEARGPEPALAELERLLNEGPPHARVRAVERLAASLAGDATGFDVAH